jgi:hypothetical protein
MEEEASTTKGTAQFLWFEMFADAEDQVFLNLNEDESSIQMTRTMRQSNRVRIPTSSFPGS